MRIRAPLVSVLILVCSVAWSPASGQGVQDSDPDQIRMNARTFEGLELRNIGPAFKSGRIADPIIHPEDENLWYAAAASGGIWKTVNAGTTWTPVFDDETSYSIGSLATDPNNPHVIWAGTGEAVGGRHVAYGDSVYRSDDGGMSWTNMGLRDSEFRGGVHLLLARRVEDARADSSGRRA